MDEIRITDLEVYGNHGVLKEENILGQKFLISLTLGMELYRAGVSDRLSDSIDYAKVAHLIKEEVEKTTFKLIEALAAHLCERILMTFDPVEYVSLEIKKPWAPILLPLETVSVSITRGWHDVYLSLGANLGNRQENISGAIEALGSDNWIKEVTVSESIETKPYGVTDQPDFINCAAYIKTLYSPHDLLDKLHEIERDGGRERKEHWGPRTIDIDILYYDDIIMHDDELTIPHPDMANRTFVLEPLCRIAPYKLHPVYRLTTDELLRRLKGKERR